MSGVNECFVNRVGRVPEDNQAITISELAQEGLKDAQYAAVMNREI